MKKTLTQIKNNRFSILLLLLVALATMAQTCDPAHDISRDNPAFLRDYLFSVEPRNNGTYTLWMRNDDIGAYCTADSNIGKTALQAIKSHQAEDILIIVEYRFREPGDLEYNGFGDGGCDVEGSKYNSVTVYKVLSIEIINKSGTSLPVTPSTASLFFDITPTSPTSLAA